MLWRRKIKSHRDPFTDPNWNLVTLDDFPMEKTLHRLHVPDNVYWDLLSINCIITTVMVSPYIWIWLEAQDRHFWTVCTNAAVPSGKVYQFCAAQGLFETRAGINKEVLNLNLPRPCYLRPRDRITIYHLPYSSGTTFTSLISIAREWRIY